MSQLARMFVVLNFLLAAGFLYAAAMFLGINHEWKKKHDTMNTQLTQAREDARKREKELQTRVEELTKESSTLKEDRSGLQGDNTTPHGRERDTAEKDKKTKDAEFAKEQGNVASANENLKRANDELSKRTDEANKLRTDAATAQAGERKANDELEKAKTEIRNRDNSIAELEKGKTEMTGKIEELEIVKSIAQKAGVDLTNILNAAPIPDAKVIGWDPDMKLVQVNAGYRPEGRSRHDARHRSRVELHRQDQDRPGLPEQRGRDPLHRGAGTDRPGRRSGHQHHQLTRRPESHG